MSFSFYFSKFKMIVFSINRSKPRRVLEIWVKTENYAFQEEIEAKKLFQWYFDSIEHSVSFTNQAHNEFRKIFLPDKQIVISSRLELGDFLSEKKGILQSNKKNIILTLVDQDTEKSNSVREVIINANNFKDWYEKNFTKTVWHDKKSYN